MSRKARSMRGEMIDFDLFALKEQINGAPITETIQNREKFIDLKRRRGTKRKLQDMLAQQESEKKLKQVEQAVDTAQTEEAEPSSTPKRRITKKES